MLWLIVGLVVFHLHHSLKLLAPNWRQARIDAWGKRNWVVSYSAISILTLVLVIYGYSKAWPQADYLYILPFWVNHITLLLMAVSFTLLMFSFNPSRMARITKYPAFAAVSLWSFAHLLANGDMASILLFGSFLIWSSLNWLVLSKNNTPKPTLSPLLYDLFKVIIGLAVWLLFILKIHYWLFGVSPIAN